MNHVLSSFTEDQTIHIGKHGWLFLWGGSNEAHRFYTEPDYLTGSEVKEWTRLLAARNKKITAGKARYIHLVVPDKLSLYPEHVGVPLHYFHHHPIEKFNAALGTRNYYLDVQPALLRAKMDYPVYYKTDTHWNFNGCFVAYKAICGLLNVVPRAGLYDRPFSERTLALDLGKKLNPEVNEKVRFYQLPYHSHRAYANDAILYNETQGFKNGKVIYVGCQAVFKNENPNAEPYKIVIFGDSYCEFRTHLLTGMLAETFREVHFIWSANVDFGYLEETRPDIVITEIAERFVKQIPTDDVDIREHALSRVDALLNTASSFA